MRSLKEMRGAVVMKGESRHKLGKIAHAVFHPSEPRLVGFIVHRHDTAGAIKHPDRFLAFDSFTVSEGRLHSAAGKGVWDDAACARLGIDFDACIIWMGMPAATSDGTSLGTVCNVEYDEVSGEILKIYTTEGPASKLLLGAYVHDPEQFEGLRDGALVFDDAAAEVEPAGGVAARAGAATASIAKRASIDGKAVAKKADEVVQKGAYKFGEMLGSTKGMFKGFKEEFDKELHRDE